MGQLEYVKDSEITEEFLKQTTEIIASKKITRVLDQPDKLVLLYNDDGFRGSNRNINFVPDRIFIENNKKVIYSDYIEFRLEYFDYILPKVKQMFPSIDEFIREEKIESVKLKSCHFITPENMSKIAMGMKNVDEIQSVLLDPQNAPFIDMFVVAEIIRKFYAGESDYVDGLLIHKSVLKFVKALLEEGVNCEYILEKLISNPDIVNNANFFKGSDDRQEFTILKNRIFRTPKIDPYLKSTDLKFLSAIDVIGTVLNDKRFGKRE